MAPQFGRLTTQLADSTIAPTDRFCDLINQRIAPKSAVTAESIFVGAMYLVSDQVNSFGGRFPFDEHQRLAELIVDSPVLVGHRKDSLPIARNFHAELVERNGERWVKCYFYWLRDSQGAESLKTNIEGGLYKECSIAFTYNLPECSICGEDIRACEHEPGMAYSSGEGESVCHFNYRQIERVLEASLVYRGAVPNTLVTTDDRISDAASSLNAADCRNSSGPILQRIDSLEPLDRDSRYLVVPKYDALPVILSATQNLISLSKFDESPVCLDMPPSCLADRSPDRKAGLLIGLQGRRRCSRSEIENYLKDKSAPVSRVVVALYPDTGSYSRPAKFSHGRDMVRILPHRLAAWPDLQSAIRAVATRDGVEIWPFNSNPLTDRGFHYVNTSRVRPELALPSTFTYDNATRSGNLTLSHEQSQLRLTVPKFDPSTCAAGRRYLVDPVIDNRTQTALIKLISAGRSINCEVTSLDSEKGQLTVVLRRVLLNGRRRFLIGALPVSSHRRDCHASN